MADGEVVQQGYRAELEHDSAGRFAQLACSQNLQPQSSDQNDDDLALAEQEILDSDDETGLAYPSVHSTPRIQVSDADFESPSSKPSVAGFFFPPSPEASTRASRELRAVRRVSANFVERLERQQTDSRSLTPSRPTTPAQKPSSELLPPFALSHSPQSKRSSKRDSGMSFAALEMAGQRATANRRPLGQRLKHEERQVETLTRSGPTEADKGSVAIDVSVDPATLKPKHSLGYLVRRYWPTIPNKPLFFTGMFLSMVVGCCTPVFSYLLSRVMSHLGQPGSKSLVTQSSIFILVVALVDGTSTFLKFYLLERCAEGWITSLRRRALALVLKQDKSFFDKPENTTSSITHTIVKDSDDTRIFVGTVVGQLAVLVSMLTMGMTWAFVAGWELTLVGLGLGPVFAIATRLQASILNKFEMSNKLKRENVSKKFHQVSLSAPVLKRITELIFPPLSKTFSNIRPIRAMSIQPVFERTFLDTTEEAYRGGVKAAPFAGLGFATGFALIYCVQGETVSFEFVRPSARGTDSRLSLVRRLDALRRRTLDRQGSLRFPQDAPSFRAHLVRSHVRRSIDGIS